MCVCTHACVYTMHTHLHPEIIYLLNNPLGYKTYNFHFPNGTLSQFNCFYPLHFSIICRFFIMVWYPYLGTHPGKSCTVPSQVNVRWKKLSLVKNVKLILAPLRRQIALSVCGCLSVCLFMLCVGTVRILYSLEDSTLDFSALSSLWKRKEQLLHITVHILLQR